MVASQGTVKRDVLAQLSMKGRIGGRNPISTLCALTDNNTVDGKKLVEIAVRDLVQDGWVQVKRRGGKVTEILPRHPREHRDRTEMSAQAKREAMFAKGVTAYLPDDMCSPVEVRRVEPKNNPQKLEYVLGGSRLDNLNTCLQRLRQAADEQGYAESTSVRKVLLTMPGVTDSIAGRMMDYLQGMNLYVTARTGFQTSSYTVDLETVITQEMIDEYKQQSRNQKSVETVSEGCFPDKEEPRSEAEPTMELPDVAEVLDAAAADPILQLVEIVERLETENTRLQHVVDEQQASIVRLSERCTRLADDLTSATEQLAQVQALADAGKARSRQVDDKVAGILARHQRS